MIYNNYYISLIVTALLLALSCFALFVRRTDRVVGCAGDFYLADRRIGAMESGLGITAFYFGVLGIANMVSSFYSHSRSLWYFIGESATTIVAAFIIGLRFRTRNDYTIDSSPITWLAQAFESKRMISTVFAAIILFIEPSVAFLHLKIADAIWRELSFSLHYEYLVFLLMILIGFVMIFGLRGVVRFHVVSFSIMLIVILIVIIAARISGETDQSFKGVSTVSDINRVASDDHFNPSGLIILNMFIISFTSMMQLPVLVRYQASSSLRSLIRAVALFAVISFAAVIILAYYTSGFAESHFPPRIDEQWRVLPNPVFGSSPDGFNRIIPVVLQFIGLHVFGRFGRPLSDFLIFPLIATAMGAVIMHLHIIGIIFSKDIYKTLIRRKCDLSESVFVGRLVMIVVGLILSVIYLYDKQSIAGLRFTMIFSEAAVLAGSLAAQSAPAFIDRLYIKRCRKYGITAGFLVGVLLVFITSDLANEVFIKIAPGISHSPIYDQLRLYSLSASMIANVCTAVCFSLIEGVAKRRCASLHGRSD